VEKTQQYPPVTEDKDDNGARRLRRFGLHLIGYFMVMGALFTVNLMVTPDIFWFVWPLVGWGGALAVHAAYAMGLFGS
jgi:hypothetical protein